MYLIHFNGNHSRRNGQFINGDGDNDGIIDDHHNYSRNKKDLVLERKNRDYVDPRDLKSIGSSLETIGKFIFYRTKAGSVWKALLNSSDLEKSARDAGAYEYIEKKKNLMYIGIANALNKRR